VALVLLGGWCARRGVPVKTASVARGDMAMMVAASGIVQADTAVKLGVKTVGNISRMYVKERDTVKLGESLAVLDTYEQARKDYFRKRELYTRGAISEQELERAKKDMDDSLIVAPFDGTITKKFVNEGETVSPGTIVFSLADLRTLILESDIYEADMGKVHMGQLAKVTFDAYPGRSFDGRIIAISQESKENRDRGVTFQVKIKLKPVAGVTFPVGMSGDVDIVSASKQNVLRLSQECVKEDSDQKIVFLVTPKNVLKRTVIQAGLENDEFVEVLSGIPEGAVAVAGDLAKLKDGMRVSIEKK
jgi:multidrug efflux pump subunit AcrA (membrane-fusion protein)